MSHRLAAALASAVFALPLSAEEIRGRVHDPQGASVAGAAVRIACGSFEAVVTTERDGTFAVTLPGPAACTAAVRRGGFAPWSQPLPAGVPAEIQLSLARREEQVDVAARHASAAVASPLGSVTLSSDELSPLGPETSRWIDTALLAAGVFVVQPRLFVNGLPQLEPPAAAAVSRVAVDNDPFSAENGSLDGGRVFVSLAEPDRRWRFSVSGLSFGPAGREMLADRRERTQRRAAVSVGGPLPGVPLVAFFQATRYGEWRHIAYYTPGMEQLGPESSAEASTRSSGAAAGVTWRHRSLTLTWALRHSRSALQNAGLGGLTAPDGASRMNSARRAYETSWRAAGSLSHRGGLQIVRNSSDTRANSSAGSVQVAGAAVDGGNELQQATLSSTAVLLKHVVEATGERPWKLGLEATNDELHATRTYNPRGVLRLDSSGSREGTWIARDGAPEARITTTAAAAFGDLTPWRGSRGLLRAGLRSEWQRGAGLFLSPRITAQAAWRGFLVALGAGRHVVPWTAGFLGEAALREGAQGSISFAPGAERTAPETWPGLETERLQLVRAPGLCRRRDTTARLSLRRGIGPATVGVEETWTRGEALAGLTRTRTKDGLLDTLNSTGRLRRRQTHLAAGLRIARLSLDAHYEQARSLDDREGAFAASDGGSIGPGEWGPSTGIARHNFSFVVSATLPGRIRALLAASAASGLPYSPISGLDAAGLYTYLDRGGLARNSVVGPSSRTLGLHLARQVALPRLRHTALDLGLRLENLLDANNVEEVMAIRGPRLGRALRSSPGRSVRFWVSAAR